jgi:LmbE family N-acetylglucosaminyl deacetylase
MTGDYQPPPPPPEPRLLAAPDRGRVLCFSPHPDDEVAGPGGALCLHRRQGDPVRVVVATDGIAGDPDDRHDRRSYPELRRSESRAGMRELGVDDVAFWGFPDSCQLSDADLELGTSLAVEAIATSAPDVIYLPWEREGHPDHHALHVCVMRAMDRSGWPGRAYGYEIWHAMIPDVILDITEVAEAKHRAMLCHRSQIEYVTYDRCVRGLNAYRSLIHARGKGYAEAFRILR